MVARLELARPSLQDHPPPNLSLIIRRVTVTVKEIMTVYCLQWKSYDISVICCDESESDDENEPQIADATPNLLHSSLKMLTCAHSKAIKEVSRVFSRGDQYAKTENVFFGILMYHPIVFAPPHWCVKVQFAENKWLVDKNMR